MIVFFNIEMRLLTVSFFVVSYVQTYVHLSEVSLPRPVILPKDGCNCDRTFILPVCSNDSYTFGNECQLKCESQARVKCGQSPIVVSFTGICQREGCICPAVVSPVCSTNGYTYENECRLTCDSERQVRLGLDPIHVKSREECPSNCSSKCPIDIIPSCGSNGVTYSSYCLIQCENVKRARFGLPPILRTPGACPDKCICTAVILPVCGTDGVTYVNECELDCESDRQVRLGLNPIHVKSRKECPSDCSSKCPIDIIPSCGSNGVTYSSYCLIQCENVKRARFGLPPILRTPGACPDKCICTAVILPVCGTDGVTYVNECELDCESDRQVRLGLNPIHVKSRKECPSDCSSKCPIDIIPSCGSNGVTYSSYCLIQCKNVKRARFGLPPILNTPGACPDKCICTAVILPVCGTDGVTYVNECELDCESDRQVRLSLEPIHVKSRKECPSNCSSKCPIDIIPSCGSNGVTYSSYCLIQCENVKRARFGLPPILRTPGACPDKCICTAVILPVCGTDGVTYVNECELDCESDRRVRLGLDPIHVKSREECPSNCSSKCPIDIIPSCGSNGVTYSSYCLIQCENVKRARFGLPPILRTPGACPDKCICTAVILPVCGTDGVTYVNECELDCESDRRVRLGLDPIHVKSREECPSNCSSKCPIDIIPSCGSNGVTYSSYCLIQCENVKRARFGLPPILRTPGACPDKCICTAVILPVCGTDGLTYVNECELNCASKIQQNNGGPLIFVAYKGRCIPPPCQCYPTIQLVCGSDERTYWNVCYLNCASFNNRRNGGSYIFLSKIGSC